jgi:hypothetical protein
MILRRCDMKYLGYGIIGAIVGFILPIVFVMILFGGGGGGAESMFNLLFALPP